MQCKWETCENESRPKSPFCSGTCKKRFQRLSETKPDNVPVNSFALTQDGLDDMGDPALTAVTVKNVDSSESSRQSKISEETEQEVCKIIPEGSYEDYIARPYAYATRANPEKLNWGEPMTFHELQASPFVANRVPVEGDWDYVGVAV